MTDSVRRLADEVRASVNDAMKTLRADLAAAAREVRDETGGATSSARTGHSMSATPAHPRCAQLQDAEAALAEFRASVRADLRLEVAHRGVLEPAVVELLATRLGEVDARSSRRFADKE